MFVEVEDVQKRGSEDASSRAVLAISYELPYQGGSRWSRQLLGGWHVNGIYTIQSGQPFTWMGANSTTIGDLVYFGDKLVFNPRPRLSSELYSAGRFVLRSPQSRGVGSG